VLRAARAVARQVEGAAEQRLVDDLLNTAAAGGRAAGTLDTTLEALASGQVQSLVLAGDGGDPGGRCRRCGRLARAGATHCPACETELDPVDDVGEAAIQQVLAQAGEITLVHGAAAERLAAEAGGMAALLRFVTHPAEPATI
jgi:peptide subunit release factor 1 (eRF1)